MFTGIVQQVAEISEIDNNKISIKLTDSIVLKIGDSCAVDGICLTVTEFTANKLCFDLLSATKLSTTAGDFSVGQKVNLETAMQLNSYVGGHMVSGHVDTALKVYCNQEVVGALQSGSWQLELALKQEHKAFVITKGSIAINGVSLTIQKVLSDSFIVELIPETLRATNLKDLAVGDYCNVEFDQMTKTIWHQLQIIEANR